MTVGNLLHRWVCASKIAAVGQYLPIICANAEWRNRKEPIWKPKACATANQRLGPAPRISHFPRGDLYFRKPCNRGWSQWASSTIGCNRPDHKVANPKANLVGLVCDGRSPPRHSICSTPVTAPPTAPPPRPAPPLRPFPPAGAPRAAI